MTKNSSKSGESQDETESKRNFANVLINRVDRSELEKFIIENNAVEIIIEKLGNADRNRSINVTLGRVKVHVEDVELRGGDSTGHFNRVNDEALIHIQQYLNCRERARAIVFVCKSWYNLRKEERLFQELTIGGRGLNPTSECVSAIPSKINLNGVSKLQITSHRKGKLNFTTLKNFINYALSCPLEYLSLHQVCKKNKLLETFAAKSEPFLSGLIALTLEDDATMESISKFLEKTPLLKSLIVKTNNTIGVSENLLKGASQALSRARQGHSSCKFLFENGASFFPELLNLMICVNFNEFLRYPVEPSSSSFSLPLKKPSSSSSSTSSLPLNEPSSSSSSSSSCPSTMSIQSTHPLLPPSHSTLPSSLLPSTFPPFLRLKSLELHLSGLSKIFRNIYDNTFNYRKDQQILSTNEKVESLIRNIHFSCPLLESLHLQVKPEYHSQKGMKKQGLKPPPEPTVPSFLSTYLSARLTDLKLWGFKFVLENFEAFDMGSKRLDFRGENAENVKRYLVEKCASDLFIKSDSYISFYNESDDDGSCNDGNGRDHIDCDVDTQSPSY